MLTSHSSWEEWFPPGLGGAHIPHLSHFHHGGIRFTLGSKVRVPDLLNDHWLLPKPPLSSPTPSSIPAPGATRFLTFSGLTCSFTQMLLAFTYPPAVIFLKHQHSLSKSLSIPLLALSYSSFFFSHPYCHDTKMPFLPFAGLSWNPKWYGSFNTCVLLFLQRVPATGFTYCAPFPKLYATHKTLCGIYGWQPLLSPRLLHAYGQCFSYVFPYSYEWMNSATKNHFRVISEKKQKDVSWIQVWCRCLLICSTQGNNIRFNWK